MKRIQVYAVGILLALLPAVFGLWGNASFSKDVPVRVPDQARATTVVVTHNTRALVAADRAGRTPVERHHARHGADDPATHDANDDKGNDPANHDANDDKGGAAGGRHGKGKDDGANHA